MSAHTRPVTVIGMGPMGQAMARAFLAAGHPTTVWNRTPNRADAVVTAGAKRAATPAEALAASELVVLSLTDYQTMYEILDGAENALSGRVIVNLSSDTPERSTAAAKWLHDHGATLIVGGVMVPAPLVGSEAAYVFYSGPKDTFAAHEPTLRLLGRPDYRGADPGLAQLYYQALLDVFLTSTSVYLHATALIGSAGVPAKTFLPYVVDTFTLVSSMLADEGIKLDAGDHPGDLATVTMMGATADHIVGASKHAGVDLALPEAVKSLYDKAIAAGHGKNSWTSLFEVVKPRSGAADR